MPTIRHWVYVIELSDKVGPKSSPDMPHLFVGVTSADPQQRFEDFKSARRHHRLVTPFGVCLRVDLGLPKPFGDRQAARRAQTVLMKKLRRQGYTINGDSRVYRVYVIELSDAVGQRKCLDKPWVYVGVTSRTPEERFQQHRDGTRSAQGWPLFSRIVHRYGIWLMPALYDHLPPCFTWEDAKNLERQVADNLDEQCYSVKGGH